MVKNTANQVVVLLPETRAYGLDYAQKHPSAVVGRVYRVRSGPNDFDQYELEPLEGGPPFYDVLHLFEELESLPAVEIVGSRLKLSPIAEISAGSRRYALNLCNDNWQDWNPLYKLPQESLASVGLRCGSTYDVAEWVVPRRALRLADVHGVYYAGLFESVGTGAR